LLEKQFGKEQVERRTKEACVGALREPAGLVSAFPGAMQFEYGM
jgi:hypothetical protein